VIELLMVALVLGVVAYCVQYLGLPEPFGKIVQVVLVVILLIAILRFAGGGGPVLWVR
jgi:hypothetical protein